LGLFNPDQLMWVGIILNVTAFGRELIDNNSMTGNPFSSDRFWDTGL